MNKIISINLKGIIFQVEEEAFDRLKQYLEQLNRHFAKDESRIEIIDDIESRIAEMMQDKLKTKAAITVADVEEIIGIMGKPADFETEDSGEDEGTKEEPQGAYDTIYDDFAAKRFFRDTENSMLGGVCAGAGHYFGIDPLWVRLGFLFLFFVFGTGLLFYLILWVIIPEAKTQSDRLRMRGEKVNIDNIEKAVKEEYERVKKNFDEYTREKGGKVDRAFNRGVGIVGKVAYGIIRLIGWAISQWLFLCALVLFIFFVSITVHLAINGTLPLLSLAFENKGEFWLVAVPILVLLLLIIIGLVSLGIRLLSPKRKLWRNRAISYPIWALSLIAIVILSVMGINFGRSFSSRQTVVETASIKEGDTLTITAFNPVYYRLMGHYNDNESHYYNRGGLEEIWDGIYYAHSSSNAILKDSLWHIAHFEVRRSQKDDWELEILRTSSGRDDYMARMYAEKIPLDYMVRDGKLVINTHFYAGKNVPFRDQEITYRLWVPKGKVVQFEAGLIEIMEYGLKRNLPDNDSYGYRNMGKTWIMGENGLKCLDCNWRDKPLIPADAQIYYYQDFDEVEVNIPAKVTITEGEDYEIAVRAPDRVKRNIEITRSGNTLKLSYDIGLFDIFEGFNSDDIQVFIKMPRLNHIKASGAAHVELKDIVSKDLGITLNGACKLEGKVSTEELDVELNGSSFMELSGVAANVDLEVGGASKFRGSLLESKNYTVDLSGASKAEISASDKISGEVSGASHVMYREKPTLKVNTSGASSISSMD